MEIENHEKKWLAATEQLAAIFSTCSKRKYFAVVLAPNKRVAGVGYNGSPPGMGHCDDGYCPRATQQSAPGSQYDNCISQHAEAGALLWSDIAVRQGGTIIVNGPPCMGCAKLIASSGVVRIVCRPDSEYKDFHKVKDFLLSAGIDLVESNE
jgi:dCMP deaminase